MTTQSADVALVGFSVGTYRLLLAAYPPQFRREYGPHMLQVFRDRSISTYNQSGPPGMLRLWAITFLDFTRSVVEEHIQRETFITRETLIRWIGGGFAGWWVLASIVGLAVGFGVGGAVGMAVGGAVVGASVGTAQWLVLRRQVSRAAWWVLATTVGFAVGLVVGKAVGGTGDVGFAVGWAVSGAVAGASVGIAQWLVLRWQLSRAGWWVLASIVGFAGAFPAFAVGMREAVAFPVASAVLEAVGIAVAGALYGAITGGVLVWLLRQPATEEHLPQDAA